MAGHPPPFASETPRPLKIVFMGTPALAAHILERLAVAAGAEFEISGVITRPDQPRKRGLKLEPSEVAAVAERLGLRTLKPAKIRTPEFLAELKALEPDLLVIAAYGRILPNPVLQAARLMPINVHASLLPRHRGAAPVEGALLAGDEESGVTIMRVTERMDAGPILLQRAVRIARDETQATLKDKLAESGVQALLEALTLIRNGQVSETPQDDNLATYTSPVAKQHALIDWEDDAAHIERVVRAYNPWPVARTTFERAELLIWAARVASGGEGGDVDEAKPGAIVRIKPEPVVKCGGGALIMVEVQAPGRRRMPAADFLRGRRVGVGARLGS